MRESVVQIPAVSTPLAVCTFLYPDAQGSNHLLSLAKAKDSRYRKFNYRTNDARISGSDSGFYVLHALLLFCNTKVGVYCEKSAAKYL